MLIANIFDRYVFSYLISDRDRRKCVSSYVTGMHLLLMARDFERLWAFVFFIIIVDCLIVLVGMDLNYLFIGCFFLRQEKTKRALKFSNVHNSSIII